MSADEKASVIPPDAGNRREAAAAPIFYRPERLAGVISAVCLYHPELPPQYICPECCGAFCAHCANFVGAVRACQCRLCGALCRDYPEVKERALLLAEQYCEFGWGDIKIAFNYAMYVPR